MWSPRRGQPRHRGRLRRLRPGRRRAPDLAAAVATAGYTAAPPRPGTPAAQAPDGDSAGHDVAGRRADGQADGTDAGKTAAKDAELAGLKRKWQVTLTTGLA